MKETLATSTNLFGRGEIHDVPDQDGQEWIAGGIAEPSEQPPPHIADLLARLDFGAGQPCLFPPFLGEFGHLILTHLRLVQFHKASRKVVCCRPGEQVLFPDADELVTDWIDPISDQERVGTIREGIYHYPEIAAAYPDHVIVMPGNLDLKQEMHCIEPDKPIPFRPKLRGLPPSIPAVAVIDYGETEELIPVQDPGQPKPKRSRKRRGKNEA